MKTLTYEAVLSMSPEGISETFPFGAVKISMKHGAQDRFRPAESRKEADYTLARLLRDKRKRTERPTFMHRDSSQSYTHDHARSLEKVEVPPREWMDRNSAEVRASEDNRRAVMRSRLAQMREVGIRHIKAGKDPIPMFDRALEKLEREDAA